MPETPDTANAGDARRRAAVSPRLPLAALAAYLRRRPYLLCLAAIAVLAMTLRLAWIAYANPDPYDGRIDDMLFFDFAAKGLAAGKGFRGFALQQTAQWPPGYPLLLAGFYKLFGHSVLLAKLLNVLAGGVACTLIYAVAAKVFNRRVGLLAALILALFPGSIYFSTLLLTESIFTALVALLLLLVLMWVLERRDVSPVRAFLLGVLFGAAALFRAEAPVLLLVVLVVWRLAVPSWQAFLPPAGFLIAGAVLAVAPWTVRNAITMHRFIPISNGVGHTLLAGQQDDPYDPRHDFPEMHLRIKYQDLPFPERETRVEDEALREALDFMFSHPLYEVQLAFEKLYHLYEDDSGALQWIRAPAAPLGEEWQIDPSIIPPSARQEEPPVYIPPAAEEWWSRLADGYYYVVLAAALAGAPLWFSLRDRKRLLLVLLVVGWTAVHLLFMPRPRYHSPLLPVFSLWAAVALVYLWDQVIVRFAGGRGLTVGEDP
jgi:4-amino-4-deoxy-L-arabinose transferase-like glycosyltransferase